MKRKVLKAMACAMSVCMMSMSLAGCGNDDAGSSSSPSGSSGSGSSASDSQESSGGADSDQSSEAEPSIGDDRSDGLFPAYDLGGVTLTLLKHNNFTGLDPDAENLEDWERAERQDKKDYIEAKYNVKLELVGMPTDNWDDMANQIVLNWTSGQPVADIMNSYFTMFDTYVANGILYDFTEDLTADTNFKKTAHLDWMGHKWGIQMGMGGEGLYYNADWIKDLDMEYTPAEMFVRGKWSYDDCFDYMMEMKNKMGEDEYPLYVAPYYWMLFATAANGETILDPSGELNYLSAPFLETQEFFAKCLENDLMPVPAVDPETGKWQTGSYAEETFSQGNTVAMAHRAGWQAWYINSTDDGPAFKFNLGFVPYPWGSNVTIDESKIGQEDAYLTLSDNYGATYFDGQLICMVKGIEEKADPMQVMSMVMEWMGWDSRMAAYVEDPEEAEDQSSCTWLENGLDKDLYFYSLSKERWEPFNSISLDFSLSPNQMFYSGSSIRSSMESFYNQDMTMMIQNGYVTEDVFHPVEGAGGTEGSSAESSEGSSAESSEESSAESSEESSAESSEETND